jgi:hypothetical protein
MQPNTGVSLVIWVCAVTALVWSRQKSKTLLRGVLVFAGIVGAVLTFALIGANISPWIEGRVGVLGETAGEIGMLVAAISMLIHANDTRKEVAKGIAAAK